MGHLSIHPSMKNAFKTAALAAVAMTGGCDYSGDFLFPENFDTPDVRVLQPINGDSEFFEPVDIFGADPQQAVLDNVTYAEIGPSPTADFGGATYQFIGTGRDVCVWVDPEVVAWNTSVAERPDENSAKFRFPDNPFDDGDLDLLVGLSAYYTGSPGVEVGDFRVNYTDSLGNPVEVSLSECIRLGLLGDDSPNAQAGRGTPDYCTIADTQPGVAYTVVLRTWSTPLDDDRLSFGTLLADGSCEDLRTGLIGGDNLLRDECVITGESIIPVPDEFGPWLGRSEITSWPNSIRLENAFCDPIDDVSLATFCVDEADAISASGGACSWAEAPDVAGDGDPTDGDANRCFCGDLQDVPGAGAL